jgi:hypothetical protein
VTDHIVEGGAMRTPRPAKQLVALLGVLVAVLTACGAAPPAPPAVAPSATAAQPPTPTVATGELIRTALAGIVRVQTPRGEGAGFAVARPNGEVGIVTNVHVVGAATEVRVLAPNGEAWPATVLARDPVVDLAVLAAPGLALPPLRLADGPPALGDPVFVVGFPVATRLPGEPSVSRGIVSAHRQIKNVEYLQTDAAMNPGNSGGPVLDAAGAVVGVATMDIRDDRGIAFEGVNFALPAPRVRAALALPPQPATAAAPATAIPPQPATPPPPPSPPPIPAPPTPAGAGEWTVILASLPDADGKTRADAEREAAGVRATGQPAGVLFSSDYQSLRPGYWVVYSRQFGAEAEARAYADELRSAGYATAYPRLLRRVVADPAPTGTGEWTVILASLAVADGQTRQDAEREAARARDRGIQAGVLRSDDFGSLRAGYWVVHAGSFTGEAEARAHADRLRSAGYASAYPRQLERA